MGLRGPTPKPTALELIQGCPGKRPVNRFEPKPRIGRPAVPKHLTVEARTHWRRLVSMLRGVRADGYSVLTVADGDALGIIAQLMADRDELQASIRKTGWLIKNKKTDHIHTNPLVHLEQRITGQILTGLKEFGLTPSSRTRINMTPSAPMADDLEAAIS